MSEQHVEANDSSDTDEKHTVQYLLNSPAYMSAVMRRQLLQEMVKSLPKPAQGRISALKNIQLKQFAVETKFYAELYELEKKYQLLYQPFMDERKLIVSGEYEPSEEEKELKVVPAASEDDDEINEKMQDVSLEIRKNLKTQYPEDIKGVPDFWLTIFRCTEILSQMVQETDEAALKKLVDIKIVYNEEPLSYTLEFHFEPNEYFTNRILTKQYYLKVKVDDEHPFAFEGPEIYKCTGCVINWNKSMNLTVKTIRKKQKHKSRGAVRTITKQVPADSFFNFFNPPHVEDGEKIDIDTQSILGTDFEIGHFLKTTVIPKAVLYYTGDIVDDEDDDFDEEEEEEEEDYEEEDSDEDGEENTNNKSHKKKANPAECQQQ